MTATAIRARLRAGTLATIRALFRRLPLKSGATRLSSHSLISNLLTDVSNPSWARLRDGTPIEVDLNDFDGRVLYLFDTNDPKVAHTALALIRSGDVFLDIGANYGTIGLEVARSVGKAGAVHLFEPQMTLADRVQAAIVSGNFDNVRLHRLGLLDKDGSFELRSPMTHSGRATFASFGTTEEFSQRETCEVRAIDQYVGPLVAHAPFGAKVDIEGSESKILPWLLQQSNLRFLIFEAANERELLYRQVKDAGYVLYGLERIPFHMRYRRIDSFEQMCEFHDVVTFKSEVELPARADSTRLAALLVPVEDLKNAISQT